jgi:hypothetical protein
MFQSSNDFLILPSTNPELPDQVEGLLTQAGLRVICTFRISTPSNREPNHSQLNPACIFCQLIILLVYGKSASPVTLMIVIDENRTIFSIAQPNHPSTNHYLVAKITQILIHPINGLFLVEELSNQAGAE